MRAENVPLHTETQYLYIMRNLIVLCMAAASLLMASCGSEPTLDATTINATLEEQQAQSRLVDDLMQTLQANREGLEYPLRAQGSELADIVPTTSFNSLPEDRQLSLKSSFNNFAGQLDAHRGSLTPLLQQLKEVERDLRMMMSALHDEEGQGVSHADYMVIRERLTNVAAAIEEEKVKILATQDEIVAFLSADDFMSKGVPQIIVNSPTM
jgi:hypothetical protein